MGNIGWAVLALARFLGLPTTQIGELAALASRARPRRPLELAENVRSRLTQLDDPVAKADLLHLPATLMEIAERLGRHSIEGARLAMLGCAIEIELFCPVRLQNLSRIRLGENLKCTDREGRQFGLLSFQAAHVKNRVAIDWPVPLGSAKLIAAYVRHWRPF